MGEPCSLLTWDSQHWGFPVAQINGSTLRKNEAAKIIPWCLTHNVRCLFLAADGNCPETLQQAGVNGFQFVDMRVDMGRATAGGLASRNLARHIRQATGADLPQLEEIARQSHRNTRFFKDFMFNPNKAAELYALWVRRDFSKQHVMVAGAAENPSKVLGFISFGQQDETVGRISLLAVSPESRGMGLGRALVDRALNWFFSQKIFTIRVITQGSNVPALRLYEGRDFKVEEVKLWYHRWFHPQETGKNDSV